MSGKTVLRRGLVALLSAAAMMVASSVVLVWASTASSLRPSAVVTDVSQRSAGATLALRDDDRGTALFNTSRLAPGHSKRRCITVTADGAARIRLYGTSYRSTRGLASHLRLRVERGPGIRARGCTGFRSSTVLRDGTLASFGRYRTGWATGLPAGRTTGASSRLTYRVTATLAATTPNTVQGGTASIGLTWEAQQS